MKLRVEMAPGDIAGNKLTTEDGELVEGVKSVQWHADAVDRPRVVVEFFAERMDFEIKQAPSMEEPHEQVD